MKGGGKRWSEVNVVFIRLIELISSRISRPRQSQRKKENAVAWLEECGTLQTMEDRRLCNSRHQLTVLLNYRTAELLYCCGG